MGRAVFIIPNYTRRRLHYAIGRAQFFSWFFSSSSTRAKTHPNHLNAPGEEDYDDDDYNIIIYTLLKNAFLIPNRSLIYITNRERPRRREVFIISH